jgi:hypothetical protein
MVDTEKALDKIQEPLGNFLNLIRKSAIETYS